MKLTKRYHKLYHETISLWKIQRVIVKYKLYRNPAKTAKIARKKKKGAEKEARHRA